MNITGMTECDLMDKALSECFGKDLTNVTFMNIEQTVDAIRKTYEDAELDMLQRSFNNKMQLDHNEEEKSYSPQKNGSTHS
jgi:hypothetical protein